MPSQTMNHGFPPSSYFSEDPHFSGEKQVGFWKMDTIRDHYGLPVNGMSGAACSMPVASSPVEKLKSLQSQATRCLEVPDNCLVQDQKVNISLQRHAIGTERAVGHSLNLWSTGDLVSGMRSDLSVQSAWDKNGTLSAHYENGLFSSSLSELFSKKLRLSLNNAVYGHSVDTVASHYEEEEPFESLEEIESQTIGNLLPDDDDLLSGVVDGLEHVVRPSIEDEIEDLDLFSSIGGMDLGDYNSTSGQRNPDFSVGLCNGQLGGSNVAIAGEHPYGEHPSRTLLVRNIDSNLEDSEFWALFERYGDIHTLYTTCKHRGFVILSYYDIRAARDAMAALQNKLLRRMRLDIHYSIPKGNPSAKDANQGTLAVFNVDSSVSHAGLLQIFGAYGEIKEIRETPHRSTQKLVEFYDTRAAEAALHALNQSEIAGKQIKLELVCPGGARLSSMQQHPIELDRDEPGLYVEQSSAGSFSHRPSSTIVECETSLSNQDHIQAPRVLLLENPLHHGISSSIPNGLPSLLRRESVCPQPGLPESGSSLSQTKNGFHLVPSHLHPHSLPEYHDGLANGVPCISSGNMPSSLRTLPCGRVENAHLGRIRANGNSSGMCNALGSPSNGSSPLPGNHYMWSNSNHPQPSALMWKNSPSFANGFRTPHPSVEFHGLPRSPSHMMNSALPMRNHHVGSAPTLYPSLLDRRNTYPGGSPEASGFHQGPIGSIRLSGSPLHHMEFASHNIISHVGANCVDLPVSSMNVSLHSHYQSGMVYPSRSQMNYMASSFESSGERARSRRSESGSMQTDNKKQYELDIDRIVSGEDNRTTLMIKNIPNKYTSKMLMAAIDEQHRGTYDFIYLPIDFKNKCNVGYAFINMTDPRHIVPFYKTFNGKKWEKFNSEKVASLAFARIQGKAALIAHFQNSSLMNEDKRCRPILFHSDGPNAGDQVPFPMGVNIRYRSGKPRSDTNEDNHQGSPPDFVSKEESSDGDSSSRSGKESELCHFQPHAIV